jgi:pimeloyl-ACP methyl ester carboxylesterase
MSAEHASGPAPAMTSEFVEIDWDGGAVRIEHRWVGPTGSVGSADPQRPLLIFLHEGLGSVSMWRDFPQRLCTAIGCRGLVYSRPGYGRSTPRPLNQAWGVDFMHRQAHELLPALLAALGIDTSARPPWLFGHSDGGSIALLHAAQFPGRVAGAIVLAPHILVEPLSLSSIARTRQAYRQHEPRPSLRDRLARHHDDPDSAFWGWNDIWLNPDFRHWQIETELATITCPLLALQGVDDEYGTMAQIDGIARQLPGTELRALAHCGHSPQRDQADAVIAATAAFIDLHHPQKTGDLR